MLRKWLSKCLNKVFYVRTNHGWDDRLPVVKKMVNVSALHGRSMLSKFMVIGLFHIHKLYCFCFWSGTLGSSVQARFTSGSFMYSLVIKEIVEAVEEALALLRLTWKRKKSLSLPQVFFFFGEVKCWPDPLVVLGRAACVPGAGFGVMGKIEEGEHTISNQWFPW